MGITQRTANISDEWGEILRVVAQIILRALYTQYIRMTIKLWRVALDLSLLFFCEILSKEFAGVFIIMAINAEIFPVRSIGRVIQVISVFVVDRQEMRCLFVEFPPTLGADEAMDFERAFSIITPGRFSFFQFL